jgi:CheY-like chemotaxis protein
MTALVPAARVLVVSDDADDAKLVLAQLKSDFPDSRAATDMSNAVQAFDEFRPEVLVLAFEQLSKAQAYSLRLYRLGQSVHEYSHRSVLLCGKEEVRAAYQLCRDGSFDDYVLFWPQAQDGLRLPMSVIHAARQLKSAPEKGPSNVELISHVKQIAAMQSLVEQHEEEDEVFRGRASASAGPQGLKSKLAPHMSGLQALGEKVRRIRPLIMLVDDDPFARKLAAKALEQSSYELAFANDGTSALALLRRMRPDLILMDVNLPDADGVSLTQKLKAAPHLAEIPILMLTGDARRQTLESSLKAGANGFVVKPFTPRALLVKLDHFLSTSA